MSSTPNFDSKIKPILDKLTPGEHICALTGEKWLMTEEEIGWYKKFNVPPSCFSHWTRWKLRTAAYTGYQVWYNKDAESGKTIITHIHPASGWKVVEDKVWFQKDYSFSNLPFDSDRPFFDYIEGLAHQVPVNAYRHFEEPKNSVDLISLGDVDCYFTVATKALRSYYSADSIDVEDGMEIFLSHNIFRSYNVAHSQNIYDSKVVRESQRCLSSYFIFDCRDCEKCFMSWNQRNKKYLWRNEQLSQEEWEKRMTEIDLFKHSVFYELFDEFKNSVAHEVVWPENFNVKADGCTGEYLMNTVNCQNNYFSEDSVDCHWMCYGKNSRNCIHADAPWTSDSYYSSVLGNSQGCKFCWILVRCQNCEYCLNCFDCENCFGCVGLRRKKFHIFNRAYSEREYWQKVDELKCKMLDRGEYGEIFPIRFCQGYIPNSGFGWVFGMKMDEIKIFKPRQFDPADADAYGPLWDKPELFQDITTLPDTFAEMTPAQVGVPYLDKEYNRPFVYQQHEIDFCKKFGIAPYHNHYLKRFWDATNELDRATYGLSKCQSCGKEIRVYKNTTFDERKVFCKVCYNTFIEQNN